MRAASALLPTQGRDFVSASEFGVEKVSARMEQEETASYPDGRSQSRPTGLESIDRQGWGRSANVCDLPFAGIPPRSEP